jgi:NADPH-dependent 2,4-dienoyl-CoA reductase/sulfur reductase-like enzyme
MLQHPARRRLLFAAGLLPLCRPLHAAARQVVVVGGGWGGLATAAALRREAPELAVTLIDRQPAFHSFALSNRWLVDHGAAAAPMRRDYASIAATRAYRFVQAEVTEIDRAGQRVLTTAGALPYDWLVLSPGIREDFSAWQMDDPAAVNRLKSRFSGAMLHASELPDLKARLHGFTGGDLLMTIPPLPYRCPPAPYERAMLIAGWLEKHRIPGRLIIVDPNPLMPVFRRILLERFRDRVTYLDHARVRSVDLERRSVTTDVDDIRFDMALLSPPQQAAGLLRQAGLLHTDGWARQGMAGMAAGTLEQPSLADERIFIIGDAAGVVSPLFGHYPKTGHLASRMGASVAARIAAQAAGRASAVHLPDSVCHLLSGIDPDEGTRIETAYRLRGDGFLLQDVRQSRVPAPAGEDVAWAAARYREFL